jgi:hypothetical protein
LGPERQGPYLPRNRFCSYCLLLLVRSQRKHPPPSIRGQSIRRCSCRCAGRKRSHRRACHSHPWELLEKLPPGGTPAEPACLLLPSLVRPHGHGRNRRRAAEPQSFRGHPHTASSRFLASKHAPGQYREAISKPACKRAWLPLSEWTRALLSAALPRHIKLLRRTGPTPRVALKSSLSADLRSLRGADA